MELRCARHRETHSRRYHRTWQEVIGVVADIYDDGADRKPSAIVYWPARLQQLMTGPPSVPRSVAFAIRSNRTGTESFLRDIREAVSAVNPDLPLSGDDSLRRRDRARGSCCSRDNAVDVVATILASSPSKRPHFRRAAAVDPVETLRGQ